MNNMRSVLTNTIITVLFYPVLASAYEGAPSGSGGSMSHHGIQSIHSHSHAPIGVMADHPHKKGEWMLSYQFMHMFMEGNRIGDNDVTPEQIVTTVPNRFFGTPMQPPTLRVVPVEMSMDMHMFGGMYAPADWLTLMVMGMYIEKSMNHITFMGGAGTTQLGTFTTKSDGFGDTKVMGIFNIYHQGMHRVQLNAGLSLPTGSITEHDTLLTPMGATPVARLPYPMQLGSGTYDLLPGIVYTGNYDKWSWGLQYTGTFRLGENDEDYSLGDKHLFTPWLSYHWFDGLSTSFRVQAESLGKIDGIDPNIVAPVQTADPDNQGGEKVSVLFGFNLAGQTGVLQGHHLALEGGFPIYQDLNGPQLETNLVIMAGWQYVF